MDKISKRRRCLALGVLLLLGVSTTTEPASACGACTCIPRGNIVNLYRGAPLNLEIPLDALEGETIAPRLERVSDGTQISASVERTVPGWPYWWLRVSKELEPDTEYRIVRSSGVVAQFTTGKTRDDSAPAFENVTATAGGNADLCAESIGAQLTLLGAQDGAAFEVWSELEPRDGVHVGLRLCVRRNAIVAHDGTFAGVVRGDRELEITVEEIGQDPEVARTSQNVLAGLKHVAVVQA